MRAVQCMKWGEPLIALAVQDISPPIPGPGQALIKVSAAGVNFADSLMIAGQYQEKRDIPFTPGMEAAGTVLETGAGVTHLKAGDRVMAILDGGAFAEQAVAAATDVVKIPDAMDFVTAAGFAIAYGTSHFALKEKAHLQKGEWLLVHGAAGGVGLTAVECGKALGARVIATAGGQDKLKVALDHGADFGIDYKSEDIRERVKAITEGQGADVIYDPVGGAVFDASLRCAAFDSRLLAIGFASGKVPQIPANILLVKNITVIGFYWGGYRKHQPERVQASLAETLAWWENKSVRPLVSRILPLDRAPEAIEALKTRAATGKVVLTLD